MEVREKNFVLKNFFRNYLSLNRSREDESATVESIRNGVEFKGINLWVLIFATFIASMGLNVNSTAVIIGAMLISPLMGPIMGVGLSIGISDFELMKRSLKSYLIATIFSVVTATLYFTFTPLNEVQSELLARTSPTIYDVLIGRYSGTLYPGKRKRNSRCSHRHRFDASTLYRRIRTGYRKLAILLRCVLSVFHQLGIHQSCYLHRS